jgi:hypothetical protein
MNLRDLSLEAVNLGSWEGRCVRPVLRLQDPHTLNNTHHLPVIGCAFDASSERISRDLARNYGVGMNAARILFHGEDEEDVSRLFHGDPSL